MTIINILLRSLKKLSHGGCMFIRLLKKTKGLLKRWSASQSPRTDRQKVVKEIYSEIHMSPGYFLSLIIANLIALLGLITNSSPVIIGAMLISPLMSPILSAGFAFITGDRIIWRKSLSKLVISIVLVILFSAIATYFSPLNDLTSEIVARTRPNLYDLIIAFLAGTVGAVAICTKKSYLTIIPGVAIATAVIPPLSVAGFGLGVANVSVALGGFFLFFTNFVAIVISTCLVFYAYGFKPQALNQSNGTPLRNRIAMLFIVLLVISLPLMYTLQKTISEVRLRKNVQNSLRRAFDTQEKSRLSTFTYTIEGKDRIDIDAVVNTVKYMKDSEINGIEARLAKDLKRNAKLHVEQVKVREGGLNEDKLTPTILPIIVPPKLPREIIKDSREGAVSVVRKSLEMVSEIISPSTVESFKVGFNNRTKNISIVLTIKRDAPLSEEETLWLTRIFASNFNLPVDLSVETIPFIPPLTFQKGEAFVTQEMKNLLLSIKDIYGKEKDIILTIVTYPESSLSYRKRIKIADERAMAVKNFLVTDCTVPQANIRIIMSRKASKNPTIRVSVISSPAAQRISRSSPGL
jgi:uncharacterized hydrophobic protein (TIGR00271 family)